MTEQPNDTMFLDILNAISLELKEIQLPTASEISYRDPIIIFERLCSINLNNTYFSNKDIYPLNLAKTIIEQLMTNLYYYNNLTILGYQFNLSYKLRKLDDFTSDYYYSIILLPV